MIIDWFTVAAQALNFVVLVWLLKRFLYRPVLRAIDAREERIARELADADAKEAAAEQERDEFRRRNAELARRRDELLGQAKEEAAAERERLVEEARQAAAALQAKRREELELEQRSLAEEIAQRTRGEVFAAARKTLADLAGTSLEARMVEVFARRLRGLATGERERLGAALRSSPGPVRVRSAFALPEEQRAAIRDALREVLAAELPARFEAAPELTSGLEIVAGGWRVAWNAADYLASLEHSAAGPLREEAGSRPGPGAGAEAG